MDSDITRLSDSPSGLPGLNPQRHSQGEWQPANSRRRGALLLFAAFAAGTLVFVATKNPTAGAVLPALFAGWGSCASGFWVLRTDPQRRRAWSCFAFQIATACWQAAAAALASVIFFVIMAEATGIEPNLRAFSATMLVLVAGVILNTLIGLVAVGTAMRNRVRVWVHPKLQRTLEEESARFPAAGPFVTRFNHAVFVIGTALALPAIAVGVIPLLILAADVAPKAGGGKAAVAAILTLFAVPAAMIPCYAWLSSRIVARSPRECWPFDGE